MPGASLRGTVVVGIFVVTALALAMGVLAYLQSLPRPVPIATVLSELREYEGRSVSLRGTVTSSWNIAGFKWYKLDDSSGEMLVVTRRGLPDSGTIVTTTGIVRQFFKLPGLSATVLLEAEAPGE